MYSGSCGNSQLCLCMLHLYIVPGNERCIYPVGFLFKEMNDPVYSAAIIHYFSAIFFFNKNAMVILITGMVK